MSPKGERAVGAAEAAPAERPEPRQQLPRAEGLGEIVVRAAVQARHRVVQFALGRQHEDRRADSLGARLARDGKAVLVRQHDVQHDQVIGPGLDRGQSLQPVSAVVHVVLLLPQDLAQCLRHPLFILHEQNPHANTSPLIPFSVYQKRLKND